MNEINETWEIYKACWSNGDPIKRFDKLRTIMTDDFEYRDPNIELNGYEKLSNYMSQFQKEFIGSSFIITDFQVHHETSLAHWDMVNLEYKVVGSGVDFAIYENGRLKQITSFFKES